MKKDKETIKKQAEQIDPETKAMTANVEIYTRTIKNAGNVRLRFRLTDGRAVQLFHKSHIRISIDDLAKFGKDGKYTGHKPHIYQAIIKGIADEMELMRKAYTIILESTLPVNSATFENTINTIRKKNTETPTPDPEPQTEQDKTPEILTFIDAYNAYVVSISDAVCKERIKHYQVVARMLERYLRETEQMNLALNDVTADILHKFWVKLKNDGTTARKSSTATSKMKMLKAFFNAMERDRKVDISPFRRIYATISQKMFPKVKDENIYYLNQMELLSVINTPVPERLQETKDAFLLQCAIGCRIKDYSKLTMDNVSVNEDGIPYIHYIAHKTLDTKITEFVTPIMYYALEIIKRYKFNFTLLKYVSGKNGYNVRIKELLNICGINRKCAYYDEIKDITEYKPLWSFGSSKMGRKTHIDILHKVQIYENVAELHSDKSKAVERYRHYELMDKFVLMCMAYKQPRYRVDSELNVIDVLPVDFD